MIDPFAFTARLARALAQELRAQHARLSDETMRLFDLGCFPWHGYLELSFLTDTDTAWSTRQPLEASVGDWRLYNFVPQWPLARDIAGEMKRHYEQAPSPREAALCYFQACAAAVCSEEVSEALSVYHRTPDFYVRVFDPDDYFSPNYCGA